MSQKKINSYIPLVKFLATIFGSNCEIVLHDTNNIEKSIISIENNHISGRKIGGPLTDFALKLIKEKKYQGFDYITDYSAKTKSGRLLRSSTYFIKNENKELIGMICLNIDVTNLVEARDILGDLIFGKKNKTINNNINKISENLSDSIEDLTDTIICETIANNPIPPIRMSQDEKIDIIKILNDKGIFLIKGAVTKVASYLEVSEATIYRYLNIIQKNK